jgi:nucleoside-diphosphate-sugar epimerase
MTAISDILSALTNLLQVPPVPALARNPDREPSCSYAHTGVAAELLDFAPRVSLIAGLARMLQFTADAERLEQAPFAPVGLDD